MSDLYDQRNQQSQRGDAQGSSSVRGDQAGNNSSYASGSELEEKGWDDEFAKQQGATGIAGGAKRAKPEYKSALDAYKKAKRAAKLKAKYDAAQSPAPAASPKP